MTIEWGPYESASGTGMRAGIQIESVSTPVNASTTFVVTFSCWVQPGPPSGGTSGSAFNDNQTFDLSLVNATLDDYSIAWLNTSNSLTPQQAGPQIITMTYLYASYGVSPGSLTINATVNGVFNGITPDVSVTVVVPARPWANPAPTTSTSASRVSDTQASVSWTNTSTTPAPYGSIKVYRKTDAGSYANIASLGVVTSYSDTGITANHKYRYQTNPVGSNGVEVTGDDSGDIWTTPGAPSGLTATKLGSGNIRLDWANNVNYSEYNIRIEESQNGGAFSELTSVSGGVTTYEHTSPSTSVTHTYRVRARSTTGSLNSAYSANSNTIILLATANPPTNLTPSGTARDAADPIVFAWQHNPADGTPQNQYRLQYKIDAGSYTTVGPTTSAVASYTLPAATLTNGHTITWHVATSGQNGTLSAYSADASFTTSTAPTVTISAPGASYTLSALSMAWTYFQAQASPQAAWTASLYDNAAVLLEQLSGTTESGTSFTTPLADGATYTVKVTVTSAAGLASTLASQTITVTYLPPAAVAVAAAYDTPSGAMVLTVTGAGPVGGVTVAIATVNLQRRITPNGGPAGAWVTIAQGLVLTGTPLTAIVLDTAPAISGTNTYRAIAYSALPSSAMSAEASTVTASAWAFLSAGPGFQTVVRLMWDGQYDQGTERSGALHHFAGREKPVSLDGEALDSSVAVSAVLTGDSSTEADFHALARIPGPKLWRDPFGRRVFARLSGLKTSRKNLRTCNITFTVSEVDYNE